ncbi:hypothetical protein HY732_02700 [Candidatus Uhrbacteria bacterium]|nr:hypothetical protein [Candidatus Uhrbacteria bacterium]
MGEPQLSSTATWVGEKHITNDVKIAMRERWKMNGLFDELSDVQKGNVPFQIMKCVDDLRLYMDDEFLRNTSRDSFSNDFENMNLHLIDQLDYAAHERVQLLEVIAAQKQKHATALSQCVELCRRQHSAPDEVMPADITEEMVQDAFKKYRAYVDDVTEALMRILGMDLMPQ